MLKQFNKKRPLLFVNGEGKYKWKGSTLVVEKDISHQDPEFYRMLYFSDAYHGPHDEIYEFADAVLNGTAIGSGNSSEALATMKLVYRIYGADTRWRDAYNIENIEG